MLAKSAATIDHVSGGRLELGLGAGWNEGEHAAYGFDFPPLGTRMELLEEQLEIVHRLWTEDSVTFAGRHYRLDDCPALPRPLQQPHPPLILGGNAKPRSVALAARLADEYNTLVASVDDCRERKSVLVEACESAGRDPATLPLTLMATCVVGEDRAQVLERVRGVLAVFGSGDEDPEAVLAERSERWVAGTPDEVVERLRALGRGRRGAGLPPASRARRHGDGRAHRRSRPARARGIAVRRFRDRAEAGRELGERLAEEYAGRPDVLVLALPRGGVVVGREVADRLDAPLDVLVVRKLGFPGQSELAMGAIASGGVRVLNEALLEQTGVSQGLVDDVVARERVELERREALYRGDRAAPDVAGRTVLVVDDGLATGSTMLAAVQALRSLRAGRVVVAVPTAPRQTCEALEDVADEVDLPAAARPVLRGRPLVRGLRRGLGR